jgi:hypothetical protein
MSALQTRADRAREYDRLHNRAAAHWSHGYGAWLPIGVLAIFPAGLVTHDHFAFPGGDISTVNIAPCGVG